MVNSGKSKNYNKNFVAHNLMGPNVLFLLEELLENVSLERGMRVLDLGCGCAIEFNFFSKRIRSSGFCCRFMN